MNRSSLKKSFTLLTCGLAIAACLHAASLLAEDRGLHGYVFALDPKGEKITGVVDGATIQFTDQAGSPVATITSDKFGYYRANLAPGVYYYKVTAPGFKDEDSGRGVNAQLSTGFAIYPFSLTPGPNDPEHKPPEIPALKIGELAGTVWERTADGRVPLPVGVAATIRLRNIEGLLSGSGAAPATVTVVTGQADPDGRGGAYQVAMAAGAWQAAVSAPGFEPLVDSEAISINADKTEPRDFELTRRTPVAPPPGQGIQGSIAIRGSDQASVLLPKVAVKIVSLATRVRHSLAPDTAGGFSRDLPSGPYVVTAELPGFRTAASGRRNVLDGKYTTVDLVLVPLPEEKPQPRELAVTAIVLEGPDEPRPSLGVSLRPDVADAAEILEVTPGSAAAAGRLTVGDRIEAVGEAPIRSAGDLIAQIQQAKVGQQLRLLLRRGGVRYQTTVTLGSRPAEGTPVEGATVTLHQAGQSPEEAPKGVTDAKGRVLLNVPAQGPHQARAAKNGYVPGAKSLTIGAGQSNQVVIILAKEKPTPPPPPRPELALVQVEVVESGTLKPVPGLEVRLLRDGQVFRSDQTRSSNRCTLSEVPYGSYQVVAVGQPYTSRPKAVEVAQPQVAYRLEVTKPEKPKPEPEKPAEQVVRLSVQVLGRENLPQGKPVSGAKVQVYLKQGGASARRLVAENAFPGTNREGIVTFELPRGNYRVTATAKDYREGASAADLTRANAWARIWLEPISASTPGRTWDSTRQTVKTEPGEPKPPPPPPLPERMTELLVQVVDHQRRPVPHAPVTLGLGNRGIQQRTSDPKGMVRFTGLPQNDWQYWLDAQSADHRMTGKAQVPVRWWVRGEVARVVLQGMGPGPGGGGPTPPPKPPERMTELLVQVVGPQGESVRNAAVTLGLGYRGVQQGTSDLKGMVRFNGLPQNDWQYWLDAQSADRRMMGKAQVPVRWWARREVVRVVLQGMGPGPGIVGSGGPGGPGQKPAPTGTLQILVLGPHGQRMPNAMVLLGLGTSPVRQEISRGDGIARFGPLEQNDWQYWVHAFTRDRSMEGRASVPVGWWGRGPVEVRLQGPGTTPGGIAGGMVQPGRTPQVGTLTVEVHGAHGHRPPVLNAQVVVSGGPGGQRVLQNVGNGQYRADLPAGQYQVAVTAPNYYGTRVSAGVAVQQTNVVRVELRTTIE